MIFWILLAVILAGAVWALIAHVRDSMPGLGVFLFFVVVVLGSIAAAMVLSICALGFPQAETSRSELRAIAVSSSVEGRFFLGSGYVDGKRVLNYITARDGFSEVEQVRADHARIYEDADSRPYLATVDHVADVWWFAPFRVESGFPRSDFHVPAGSILENFTIDNQ